MIHFGRMIKRQLVASLVKDLENKILILSGPSY